METITTAKNILNNAATNVLKCQMYGKLKIPWSAILISKVPKLNFIDATKAIELNKTK